MASKGHMEQVEQAVVSLSEFVQVIMGSQRYLQRKLDHHRTLVVSGKSLLGGVSRGKTCLLNAPSALPLQETSCKRTLGYSMLEVFFLLTTVFVQISVIQAFLSKQRHRGSILSV
jgi:hypothetical protein